MYNDFKRKGGTVSYEVTDNTLYLQELICDRGQGRAVMSMFLKYVRSRYKKVSNIHLDAFDSYGVPVESLVRFYSSFGFKPETRLCKTNSGESYVTMRLWL